MPTVNFDLTASELDGTRVDGTSLKIDWNLHANGANVRHLYRLDELDLTDGFEDIGSAGIHLNNPQDVVVAAEEDSWLDRAAYLETGNYAYSSGYLPAVADGLDRCYEGWFYLVADPPGDSTSEDFLFGNWRNLGLQAGQYRNHTRFFYKGYAVGITVVERIPEDQWFHFAGTVDIDADLAVLFINGVARGTKDITGLDTSCPSYQSQLLRTTSGKNSGSYADDVRVTVREVVHSGTTTFYPRRYEDGNAVLIYTPAAAYRVQQIEWTATTGAAIGKVAAIYVNEGDDDNPSWTQVGGADPTSPITGLDYIIPATVTKPIKCSLAPRADALQSETPTLLTASMETAAVGGGIVLPVLMSGQYV